MKLQVRFVQLPVTFDAKRLEEEISAVGPEAWLPHPAGYAGNDFLPLIAANGDPRNDAPMGPMRPTPHLMKAPYLQEVLASLGAVWGRSRLMRLSGHAEVDEHVDVNYYWRDHMRVHVPIVTQPTVRFECADEAVNMAPGECWIFDTWSMHRVINDAERARIHLVADTVGGEGFWSLMNEARVASAPPPPGWSPRFVAPGGQHPPLRFERTNAPTVMSPWELRENVNFLLGEAVGTQPLVADAARLTTPFLHKWRALWAAYGEAEDGWPHYRALLDGWIASLTELGVNRIELRNGIDLQTALSGLVFRPALARAQGGAGGARPAFAVAPGA